VAYEARGYKQGWADGKAGKTGKPTVQIEPKSRVVISNNSYTHDEQVDNPGQNKEGSTVSSISCDRC